MKIHPACWYSLIVAMSAPFLTPCTMGLGAAGSRFLSSASEHMDSSAEYAHLPTRDLALWVKRPGPHLKVSAHVAMAKDALVTDAELAGALTAPKPPKRFQPAKSVVNGLADLFYVTDFIMADAANIEPAASDREDRRQLVLNKQPFVLLQGVNLTYTQDSAQHLLKARATSCARLTVITPEGSYFALAHAIHYNASRPEILLEGNPSLQSGEQWVKSDRADGWMKINVATKSVSLNGGAVNLR